MTQVNEQGYPFVGIFCVTLFTEEFMDWVENSFVTSAGYRRQFEINDTYYGICNLEEFRNEVFAYYTNTFNLSPTKEAMVHFYQNKWSGRYWAKIDGKDVKPDECNKVLKYTSDTRKSFN